jgi:hypothetical protein
MASEKPNTKFISIAGIGEVSITKNRLSRRFRISINQKKIVKVSIPFRISFSEGERFLFEKIEWVKKSIEKFDKYVQEPILIDEQTEFHTRTRTLKLSNDDVDNFQMNISGSGIHIICPNKIDLKSPHIQEQLKYFIFEAMRLESKEYFPGRVAELARVHGFKYSSVKIRNSKSRWGSCSYTNGICLSLNLICIPDILSDYVILHELVHTKHKNHGPDFWNLLEKVANNAKFKSKELKRFRQKYWLL